MDLRELTHQFLISGQVDQVIPFGDGHINDTFRVCTLPADEEDFLLQKINQQVFQDVSAMMNNIRMVTDFVNAKEAGFTLEVIPTIDQHNYYEDLREGTCWRMYRFRKSLQSFNVPKSEEQVYQGALAFGKFVFYLEAFPVERLHKVLPDFHNVIYRLDNFLQAMEADAFQRVAEARHLVNFVLLHAKQMQTIERLGQKGKIPRRVVHNDTKFNNLLFDQEGIGRCVIDLETLMPGLIHYDFGDGIRTSISLSDEDETDLDQISIDLNRFKAFASGYLTYTRQMLIKTELQFLSHSPALLAYIMGVRFLTDYLQGDIYYKTHYPKQNLFRAQAQLNLTEKLLDHQGELTSIIRGIIKF